MPVRLGPVELLIILAIVVVLFGAGRIANIGTELGSAIRNFRDGMRSNDEENADEEQPEAEKTKS